jgi:hypothetical protein
MSNKAGLVWRRAALNLTLEIFEQESGQQDFKDLFRRWEKILISE